MKAINLLLVSFFVLLISTALANEEYIGPAFRVDDQDGCGFAGPDFWYAGRWRVQFSNGKTGHATFKCKLKLTMGDGVIYYAEGDTGSWPLDSIGYPGAMCYSTTELDVESGMWTAQCFGAWNIDE